MQKTRKQYYIVVTWARVVCLIYTPKARGPQAEGVYIRQTTSAYVTTVMYHLFIGQKPT